MTKKYVLVFASYFVIALGLTYPLVLNFADHIPGTETWAHDEYTFLWNFWWFKHAVLDLGIDPLHTNFTFYPIGNGLITYTYTLLNAILAIPIELVFGYAAASNSVILLAITTSAFGTFLLILYLLRHSARLLGSNLTLTTFAAFSGGAVYGFASSRFVYAALGHTNFVSSEYLPYYALFFIKTMRERAWKNAFLAAVFAALAILTETTYAVFIALFSLVYLLFAWRENGARWFWRLVAIGAATGLLASPLLVPSVIEFANVDYSLPEFGHAEKLLVDLVGLVTPTSLQPYNRNWVAELDAVRQGTSRFVDVNTVFLGYATLALALVGAWVFRKSLGAWIGCAITFAVLSFGPFLHINGQSEFSIGGFTTTLPMPFLALHYVPFLKENRVPNRFGILVMLALAVLGGFAIARITQRAGIKNRQGAFALSIAFALLILLEHSAVPLPLTDAHVPDVYALIAHDPGDYAIFTLPFGLRNSFSTLGAEDTRTQYYQSVHQKFLLSGNTSRNPPIQFDYFDRLSLFHSLSQVELYNPIPPDVIARDKAQAAQLAAMYDIRYLVINPATTSRVPYSDTIDATISYVRQVFPLGEKIYEREGVVAYRVIQPPLPTRLQVKFGTDAALPFLAEGWTTEEVVGNESANWVSRREARLLVPARAGADYLLTLRAQPFAYVSAPTQTLELVLNGQVLQRFDLKPGWDNYSITLPEEVLHSGVNDLRLKFAVVARPRDVLPANNAVGSTGTLGAVDIVATAGTAGSIVIQGREVSRQEPGYNIVSIDSHGNVMKVASFNTADKAEASTGLVDFIAQTPNGAIVVVVSQDEIADKFTAGAFAALESIGAQNDPRKDPNRAHAIIGVKGAKPGSALERWNDGEARVSIGHVPDDRTLAAAVSSLTIERR